MSNIELLHELPFYDELSVVEISKAFKGYARSYKDPLVQLEASKSNIEDLFKDLLNEMKDFKYQITVTVLLRKHKENRDMKYAPVYFNLATKRVINSDKYDLDKYFQEILYRADNWINEESGWITESINGEYVNISVYSPSIRSTYIELPDELNNPMKGLINIKNNDDKCLLWCYIRNLNLVKTHPERVTKEDKKMINDLDFEGILICFKKRLLQIENSINLFLIIDVLLCLSRSLIMCISKILTDLCAIKQKIKTKNIFANVVYSFLVVKKF